jgi:hypothetical protein
MLGSAEECSEDAILKQSWLGREVLELFPRSGGTVRDSGHGSGTGSQGVRNGADTVARRTRIPLIMRAALAFAAAAYPDPESTVFSSSPIANGASLPYQAYGGPEAARSGPSWDMPARSRGPQQFPTYETNVQNWGSGGYVTGTGRPVELGTVGRDAQEGVRGDRSVQGVWNQAEGSQYATAVHAQMFGNGRTRPTTPQIYASYQAATRSSGESWMVGEGTVGTVEQRTAHGPGSAVLDIENQVAYCVTIPR